MIGPYSVGDVTRDGGKVERLIPAREFLERWRQMERINDSIRKQIFDLLRRNAEDVAESEAARWDEAAKLAGHESLAAANKLGLAFVCQYGTGEILEISQAPL